MSDDWVFNASPLIALGKAGALDVLPRLCRSVLVPQAVYNEINAGPVNDPARLFVGSSAIERLPDPQPARSLEQWGLGAGETAVIAVALSRPGSRAVLDDAMARRAARSVGLRCIGTLGIVLRGAELGVIPNLRDMVDRLRAAGLYLDDQLIDRVLREFGAGHRGER